MSTGEDDENEPLLGEEDRLLGSSLAYTNSSEVELTQTDTEADVISGLASLSPRNSPPSHAVGSRGVSSYLQLLSVVVAPLVILISASININVFTLLYSVLSVLLLCVRSSRILYLVGFVCLLIVSALHCITIASFFAILRFSRSTIDSPNVLELLRYFGCFETSTHLQTFTTVWPMLITLVLAVSVMVVHKLSPKCSFAGSVDSAYALITHVSVSTLLVGLSIAWQPSVFSAVLMLILCVSFVVSASGGSALLFAQRSMWLQRSLLALMALLPLVYQLPAVNSVLPPTVARILGLEVYMQWGDLALLPWAPFWGQAVSCSATLAALSLSARRGVEAASRPQRGPASTWMGVYGWSISLLAVLVTSLLVGTVLHSLVLLAVFACTWIPNHSAPLHYASRVVAFGLALSLFALTYLLTLLGAATPLPVTGLFPGLGLQALSPLYLYVLPQVVALGIFSLHLHLAQEFRASQLPQEAEDEVALWLRRALGDPQASVLTGWADGTRMLELLQATNRHPAVHEDLDRGDPESCWRFALEALHRMGVEPARGQDAQSFSRRQDLPEQFALQMHSALTSTFVRVTALSFLRQSHKLALVALWFTGLTVVSIFNAGYMVFFFLFLLSSVLASKFWVILVGYTQVVITLMLLWQSSVTIPWQTWIADLFGFRRFADTPGGIWLGLVWHLVTLAFAVMQLLINRYLASSGPIPTLASTTAHPFLKWIVASVMDLVYRFTLLGCYAALLLTGLLSQQSLITLAYILFLDVCLVIHYTVPVVSKARSHIRRFWVVLIFFVALILVIRYLCQFPEVYAWLVREYPAGAVLSLADLGLVRYNDDQQLFLYLSASGIVLILAVYQWGLFSRSADVLPTMPTRYPVLISIYKFLLRLMILHIGKVVCVVAFAAVALQGGSRLDAVGFFFALVTVICLPLRRRFGGAIRGFLLLILCQVLVAAHFLFQIDSFETRFSGEIASWIGFSGVPQAYFVTVVSFVAISLLVVVQRWTTTLPYMTLGSTYRHSQWPQHLMLFTVNPEFVASSDLSATNALHKVGHFLSVFYCKFGVHVFLLMVLLVVFVRRTLLSLPLFVLVAVTARLPTRRVSFVTIYVVLSLLLLLQYVFSLGLPSGPFFPTPGISASQSAWLLLRVEPPLLLLADFFAVFLASLLVHLKRDSVLAEESEAVFTDDEGTDVLSAAFGGAMGSDFGLGEPDDQERDMQDSVLVSPVLLTDTEFRSLAASLSSYITLVLVFVAGSAQPDVLSLVYAVFSLYFLIHIIEIMKKDAYWVTLRRYNFFVIALKGIYQIPWVVEAVSSSPAAVLATEVVGLRTLSLDSVFSAQKGVILDLLITMFLTCQLWIIGHESFEETRKSAARQRMKSRVLLSSVRSHLAAEWIAVVEKHKSLHSRLVTLEKGIQFSKSSHLSDDDAEEEADEIEGEVAKRMAGPEEVKESWRDKVRQWPQQFLLFAYNYPYPEDMVPQIPSHQGRAFFGALFRILSYHTDLLVYFFFAVNMMNHADVLSVLLVFSSFGYSMFKYPVPSKSYWKFTIYYVCVVLFLKVIWQLPIFCMYTCQSALFDEKLRLLTPPYIVGIYTFDAGTFLSAVWTDIGVLLSLCLHRAMMIQRGLWQTNKKLKMSQLDEHSSKKRV